jgi:hypothetical protein
VARNVIQVKIESCPHFGVSRLRVKKRGDLDELSAIGHVCCHLGEEAERMAVGVSVLSSASRQRKEPRSW